MIALLEIVFVMVFGIFPELSSVRLSAHNLNLDCAFSELNAFFLPFDLMVLFCSIARLFVVCMYI